MEYQQKKEQILANIEFQNLLTFNLVENKLERNFKAIVEALLLTQTKTDDLQIKTDTLENKVILNTENLSENHQNIQNALKHMNQKIVKLEAGLRQSKQAPSQSMKQMSDKKIEEREKYTNQQPLNIDNGDFLPKSDFNKLQKKVDDITHQLTLFKDKIPSFQLMGDGFDVMKRDIALLKGQLVTINKSNKSIKRQSLSNMIKKEESKQAKSSILTNSNLNIYDAETKQNQKTKIQNSQPDSSDFEKQIQGVHIQINTLNLCFEEAKMMIEELRKKDYKTHSTLSELEDRYKKMQLETRKEHQNFEKQIKDLQIRSINQSKDDSQSQTQRKTPEMAQRSERHQRPSEQNNINHKNQLNDRLSKLQNSLLGFITQNQFNRFKTETRGMMDQLEKKHQKLSNQMEEEFRKIYDLFINKDLDLNRVNESLATVNESIKQNSAQAERKNNIAIAKIEQLKKNLQNLREDLEFYKSLADDSKDKKQIGINQTKSVEKQDEKKVNGLDNKTAQDLKKYFNNKLHDQRAYLIGLVRDLQKKLSSSSHVHQQIANIWDKINQFNLFLGKKADAEDTKKNIIYLQKKIGRITSQFMKSEDNTEDARIAKTNWFCLSCDKSLLGYQGKIGKHIAWQTMPLKGLMKNIEKKGLPSLKSK